MNRALDALFDACEDSQVNYLDVLGLAVSLFLALCVVAG